MEWQQRFCGDVVVLSFVGIYILSSSSPYTLSFSALVAGNRHRHLNPAPPSIKERGSGGRLASPLPRLGLCIVYWLNQGRVYD